MLDADTQRLQFVRIPFAEYVLVKRNSKAERMDRGPGNDCLRITNSAIASPGVEFDVNSPLLSFIPAENRAA